MPKACINYALASALLSQGLNYEQAAKQVGAKTGKSLKAGLIRRGVTLSATRRGDFALERAMRVATTVVDQASKRLRVQMSDVLQSQTSALAAIPTKSSLQHIAKVAAVIEPLARTAKIVHNWGDNTTAGIVLVGAMDSADTGGAPTIDLPCVSDTPIGCVCGVQDSTATPQETQAVEPDGNAT